MRIKLDEIKALHADKLVTVREHPSLPLSIVNYTPEVQFARKWTPTLLQCRGLVFTDSGQIVARPFPKFFNLQEHDPDEIPRTNFEVWEKMDGSLGVLFNYNGFWHLASRGSFNSDQAEVGTEILWQNYEHYISHLQPEKTYMVEIIYPENRIVVDYGGARKLVMLGANATHENLSWSPNFIVWPDKPKCYTHIKDVAEMAKEENGEDEGFVVTFDTGMKIKYKFAEYLRLHRIMTEASNVTVWESLSLGYNVTDIAGEVPDEFYEWLKKTANDLLEKAANMKSLADEAIKEIRMLPDRKAQALAIKEYGELAPVLFAYLDHRYDKGEEIIWKKIKPKYEKALLFKEATAKI